MSTTKFSKQREAIKNYLQQTTSHPTAATIYEKLRNEIPNISLGTVYRNLNFLTKTGEIMKISCDDGSDRFDGNPIPHYHFICRKCHRVFDLTVPSLDHIDILASSSFKGKIEGHIAYFYGICEDCLAQNK